MFPFTQVCKNYDAHFNGYTENLVWKNFQISDFHKRMAKKHSALKGINIEVTGYPPFDMYSKDSFKSALYSPWHDKDKVRIIIALHHSVFNSTVMGNSRFVELAELLRLEAVRYKDIVQFSFKPHPLLKDKLLKSEEWGLTKTEEYWGFWKNSVNCQLDESEYEQLFFESDALIHDCSSFITEYTHLGKPALYLNKNVKDKLNSYGLAGYELHSEYDSESSVSEFIDEVVKLKSKVGQFDFPIGNISVSSRVITEIERALS
jgi:CDP-glycerol glycerophosphotransferase (TagB/SpsB family)